MMGHVVKKDRMSNFSELVDYAVSHLDGLLLLKCGNTRLDAFCELNGIHIFRINFVPEGFQLGIRFENSVEKVCPLDARSQLWLERYLCAELEVQSVEQNSDGGGYVYYLMKMPNDRYDQICPGYGSKEYWWDGGEWRAHN